jgi:microcompartment protein CcmL/EutN
MKAIGLIEIKDMGLGLVVADAIAKAAPVDLLEAKPICPGWFFILFTGESAAVTAAATTGAQIAGERLIAKDEIYKLSDQVIEAMTVAPYDGTVKSLGIIETKNLVAGIRLADLAAKGGCVDLMNLKRSVGNAGKVLLTFTGETAAVNQAVDSIRQHEMYQEFGVSAYVIAKPSKALLEQM